MQTDLQIIISTSYKILLILIFVRENVYVDRENI